MIEGTHRARMLTGSRPIVSVRAAGGTANSLCLAES